MMPAGPDYWEIRPGLGWNFWCKFGLHQLCDSLFLCRCPHHTVRKIPQQRASTP